MKKINLKGVSIQTWVRTIVLALALVSQVLVMLGKSDRELDTDRATEVLTMLFTIVASVWSWWKNNSFTDKAQKMDTILHEEEIDKGDVD